jgi:hypothetical protein
VLAHAVAEARRRGAERLNDPRRPERGGLLRAQRRGADRRGAFRRGGRSAAAALRGQARSHGVTVTSCLTWGARFKRQAALGHR